MKEIIFYKLPSGKSPIEDFLDSLSSKEAQKAVWVLNLIEELETVSSKYYKKLVNTDDIIEVRVQIGKKHFRLLGFEDGGRFVVLTNGFKKKDQKVPKQEIKLAKQRKQDYLERRKDNE
jgi:phage-related protein